MPHRVQSDSISTHQPTPTKKPPIDKQIDILDTGSACGSAAEHTNMTFFGGNDRSSYTNSYSWKSRTTHLANEFNRIQRLVRHVAPEQFRDPARPSDGPCDIVPTTLLEYVEHSRDILEMKTKQMEKNLAAKREAQRVRRIDKAGEKQLPIKSRFGKNAKIYSDGLSPVLCQRTIWSAEYEETDCEQSAWPAQSELQECGDNRENERMPTRCGRYLPPPKHKIELPGQKDSDVDDGTPVELYMIKRPLPLDEHGPIFRNGPSPIEITTANYSMDTDQSFEGVGRVLVGEELMGEIGV